MIGMLFDGFDLLITSRFFFFFFSWQRRHSHSACGVRRRLPPPLQLPQRVPTPQAAMFWRMAGLAQASPIEGILDGGDFTLEDLMDEDDLIQECKSLNSRLAALYVGARPRRERTPPDAGAAAAARWRRRSERPACGGFVRVAVRGHRQRSRVLVAMAAEHHGAASRLEIGR